MRQGGQRLQQVDRFPRNVRLRWWGVSSHLDKRTSNLPFSCIANAFAEMTYVVDL